MDDKPTDYVQAGYDDFLRRDYHPPIEKVEAQISAEVPQVPASTVKGEVSQENIQNAVGNLVQLTGLQNVSISLPTNTQVTLTSTLSDKDNPSRIMLGIVEMTIYEDTAGSGAETIPFSNGLSKYEIHEGYSYHYNATSATPGAGLTYQHTLRNISGSTHTIYWIFRWRYLGKETTPGSGV